MCVYLRAKFEVSNCNYNEFIIIIISIIITSFRQGVGGNYEPFYMDVMDVFFFFFCVFKIYVTFLTKTSPKIVHSC